MEAAQFRDYCLEVSQKAAEEYRALWQELGLSVDWTQTYRTIEAVGMAQWAFVDLYEKDLVYRREAPVIWCPACATAMAQADLEEVERDSAIYTLAFSLENGTRCLSLLPGPSCCRLVSRCSSTRTIRVLPTWWDGGCYRR